jgi:signal transduction histidine kinase
MAVTSDVHARVEAFENLRHFTSIVSHDLRSPMVAIANLARWLGEDVGDLLPEESARHLELLESRIERVLQLLRDLLEYSRIGRKGVTLERVDTGELVASVGEFLSIPDGFTLEIDDEMPVLETSEALLHQVLSNLIHNAVAHHDTDAGTVRVGAVERDGYVFFRVADDGPGIPEAGRHHIFEIFETSHSAEDGEHTGLGLAIVERIVRTVGGGTVEVESPLDEEAGRGTAMIFAWPVRWKLDETILQTGFDEI